MFYFKFMLFPPSLSSYRICCKYTLYKYLHNMLYDSYKLNLACRLWKRWKVRRVHQLDRNGVRCDITDLRTSTNAKSCPMILMWKNPQCFWRDGVTVNVFKTDCIVYNKHCIYMEIHCHATGRWWNDSNIFKHKRGEHQHAYGARFTRSTAKNGRVLRAPTSRYYARFPEKKVALDISALFCQNKSMHRG